jgi:hypothetical protein
MQVMRARSDGFPAVAFRRSPGPSLLVFGRAARGLAKAFGVGVQRSATGRIRRGELDAAFRLRRIPNANNERSSRLRVRETAGLRRRRHSIYRSPHRASQERAGGRCASAR